MPKQKQVEDWLGKYDNPMKPVVEKIREIILEADPRLEDFLEQDVRANGSQVAGKSRARCTAPLTARSRRTVAS